MDEKQYLESSIRVGITDYAIGEKRDTVRYSANCGRFPVIVSVSLATVQFDGYHVTCVVTDRVDISGNLPLNGYGSYCYQDEAQTMERAVAAYCRENGFTICKKESSWPYAVAVVTKFETVSQPQGAQQ